MKLKLALLATAAYAAMMFSASAVTVTIQLGGNPFGPSIVTSGNAMLPAGSVAKVGFFDGLTAGDVTTLASSNDPAQINAAFTQFGADIALGGAFSAYFGVATGDNAAPVGGSQIYVWVLSGSNDPLAAAEHGLFSNGNLFPSGDAAGQQAFGFVNGDAGQSPTAVGGVGSTSGTPGDINSLQLQTVTPIPEPSVSLFALAGALGLLLQRRRRR